MNKMTEFPADMDAAPLSLIASPLSARAMPMSTRWTIGGKRLSNERAIMQQRIPRPTSTKRVTP